MSVALTAASAKSAAVAWSWINKFHVWLCSAAAILALCALWVHKTPLGLLQSWHIDTTPVEKYLGQQHSHVGLLAISWVIAGAAMIALIIAGREEAFLWAELNSRRMTLPEHRVERKYAHAQTNRNLGWMWVAVVGFTQAGFLTEGRMWVFALAVLTIHAVASSWELAYDERTKWMDRRSHFFFSYPETAAYALMVAASLPLRMFGLFANPLVKREELVTGRHAAKP